MKFSSADIFVILGKSDRQLGLAEAFKLKAAAAMRETIRTIVSMAVADHGIQITDRKQAELLAKYLPADAAEALKAFDARTNANQYLGKVDGKIALVPTLAAKNGKLGEVSGKEILGAVDAKFAALKPEERQKFRDDLAAAAGTESGKNSAANMEL